MQLLCNSDVLLVRIATGFRMLLKAISLLEIVFWTPISNTYVVHNNKAHCWTDFGLLGANSKLRKFNKPLFSGILANTGLFTRTFQINTKLRANKFKYMINTKGTLCLALNPLDIWNYYKTKNSTFKSCLKSICSLEIYIVEA